MEWNRVERRRVIGLLRRITKPSPPPPPPPSSSLLLLLSPLVVLIVLVTQCHHPLCAPFHRLDRYAHLESVRLDLPSRHCWAVEATRNASAAMRLEFDGLRQQHSDDNGGALLPLPRLQFFLSTQLSNTDVTRHILEDCDFGPMPPPRDADAARDVGIVGGIDGIGPAVYFGPDSDPANTAEGVLLQMEEQLPATLALLDEHASMVRARSNGTLRVMAYVSWGFLASYIRG